MYTVFQISRMLQRLIKVLFYTLMSPRQSAYIPGAPEKAEQRNLCISLDYESSFDGNHTCTKIIDLSWIALNL